jgi:DNA-binding beta-propeller fold protein YncE
VVHLDPTGTVVRGVFASGASSPHGIAVDPVTGYVLVIDQGSHSVTAFDPSNGGFSPVGAATTLSGSNAPTGIAVVGGVWYVSDDTLGNPRIITFDPKTGSQITAFSTSGLNAMSPQGVTLAADGVHLAIVDKSLDEVLVVTTAGAPSSSFSTSSFGSFSPSGIVFDGTNYRVVDDGEQLGFSVPATGLSVTSFSTASAPFGSTNPQDVTIAPDGVNLAFVDPSVGIIAVNTAGTTLLGPIVATANFGSFFPNGIVFDGTNYRVTDLNEDAVFAMAPGGLPVSSFSTAAAPFNSANPQDVTIAPDGTNVAFADPSVGIMVVNTAGTTLLGPIVSTADFGSFFPSGIVYDGSDCRRADQFDEP